MKIQPSLLIIVTCCQPLLAQVVVEEVIVDPAPPQEVIIEKAVPIAPPQLLDRAAVRRQLSIQPREVVVPEHPPGTVVETETTTTTVDAPGQPRRVYVVERDVVIVEGRELPYITVPVLFVKETAELLDAESRMAIEETAAAIHEILKTDPAAMFDIEGHTSTDGTDEFNLQLSADRARRIHQELTRRYTVPISALSAHGYGEMYPRFPSGTEEQMVLDRRVLVVRKR